MARFGSILLQPIHDAALLVMDESSGEEIVIPGAHAEQFARTALALALSFRLAKWATNGDE